MHYLIIIVALAALSAWTWRIIRRSTATLRQWAAEHGFELLSCEIPLGRPFCGAALGLWSPSFGRMDYSVTLRDRTGLKRSARVCCGRFVRGMFLNDQIEVRWSDETMA